MPCWALGELCVASSLLAGQLLREKEAVLCTWMKEKSSLLISRCLWCLEKKWFNRLCGQCSALGKGDKCHMFTGTICASDLPDVCQQVHSAWVKTVMLLGEETIYFAMFVSGTNISCLYQK